jgi:hypothetical protein
VVILTLSFAGGDGLARLTVAASVGLAVMQLAAFIGLVVCLEAQLDGTMRAQPAQRLDGVSALVLLGVVVATFPQ